MKKLLIYDWPTRFFHWTFAALLVSAYLVAQTADSESSFFSYHMILGLTLAFVALLRIVWGIIGSRYARFSGFPLRPSQIFSYFKELFSKDAKLWVGHNPASSWTAIVMLFLALGLAVSGVLMAERVQKDVWEEVHELFANFFLVAVVAHIGGVVFHMLKHRDALGMSMLHGQKQIRDGDAEGIVKPHLVAGLVFLALTAAFFFNLLSRYDQQQRALHIFGATLHLGEGEGEHGHEHEHGHGGGD